jgi:hypothetical protein
MDGKLCFKNCSSFSKDNLARRNFSKSSFLRVFFSLEKIPFGMGMDGTSSATVASSTLQTIEELVTSLKVEVEMVPGGFTGTLEIEEQGVESCELSERGVKRKNINIRMNKLIVIRESTNKPNEMNRAFLSALSS